MLAAVNHWLKIALLNLLPVSELRGGLPYALYLGIPWYQAYPFCVALNTAAAPLVYVFLSSLHRLLYRWRFYARLFDRIVLRARGKLADKVERFGFWGISLFVGIPLPVTGAWTGTLGAWILGLGRKKTILAVFAGVCLSGIIVSVIYLAGITALDFIIKHV